MAEYRDRDADFTRRGARVVALSVDLSERSEPLRNALRLPFPLLCDPQRRVVERWGLLNQKEHGGIAYPAVFVIDRDRTVRYRSLDRTAARVHADDVLAFLVSGDTRPAEGHPRRARVLPNPRDWFLAITNALGRGVRTPRG